MDKKRYAIAKKRSIGDNISCEISGNMNGQSLELDTASMTCQRCSVILDQVSLECLECSVCGESISTSSNAKRKGVCFLCKQPGHWRNQCVNKTSSTRSSDMDTSDENGGSSDGGSAYFKSTCATDGIIELMSNSLRLWPALAEFHLCSPVTHISQTGTVEGSHWSCGYRNIQMLCTSLMQQEQYRKYLFQGASEVPDIHGLQSWIERAWNDGFDADVLSAFSSINYYLN
jgi:hypothetical protein